MRLVPFKGVAIEPTLRGAGGSEAGLETGEWSRPFRGRGPAAWMECSRPVCPCAGAGDRARASGCCFA